MKITIDFETKEISYPEDVSLADLAQYLVHYFDEEKWGDFEVLIHENDGIDEDTDSDGDVLVPG